MDKEKKKILLKEMGFTYSDLREQVSKQDDRALSEELDTFRSEWQLQFRKLLKNKEKTFEILISFLPFGGLATIVIFLKAASTGRETVSAESTYLIAVGICFVVFGLVLLAHDQRLQYASPELQDSYENVVALLNQVEIEEQERLERLNTPENQETDLDTETDTKNEQQSQKITTQT